MPIATMDEEIVDASVRLNQAMRQWFPKHCHAQLWISGGLGSYFKTESSFIGMKYLLIQASSQAVRKNLPHTQKVHDLIMKGPPFETKGPLFITTGLLLHITTPYVYLYYKPFPFFGLEQGFQQSDKLIVLQCIQLIMGFKIIT